MIENKSNQKHTTINPYHIDKSEYDEGYEGCAKSGTGLPIVNKLFGSSLCDTGIATKEYDNNRKI
nr:hypothetical protein [uncultured Campylobacter sp.]